MKTSNNNNNIERLRKITFIICVPFYACTYKEKGTKRAEKGYQNRDKFFAEIVSILQADGWTLTTMGETLDCGKSTCPELAKGNERIYCHPEELTGEVQDEKAFAEILKEAASFRIVKKEARDIYVCADNEEGKQLYRDTYRDHIDEVIRDVVYQQTNIYGGRKGYWIDLDSATRIIGERIFIATKSKNAEYNSETVLREYVMEELCRLQDAGRIEATTNKHGQTIIKWTPERILAYIARCKELEAEALAQMPYKVGDTVKSRDGVAGRVVEMYPEVTGDTDSPHLIYERDGKPFVSVVILDAEGTRHAAHWSFFTLQETPEITEAEGIKIGDTVRHNKHEEVATVTSIREAFVNRCDGYRYLYTLDFGQSVKGPFGVELNGGEFLREAFTPCTPDTISTEDKPTATDPRFTLNRYNISPVSKYINDLGTICANIRPEDDPEGKRLGYCRYMTKKPGGKWTENRCMSWYSLEYSLYVFNAREMTFAERVEDRDGMEKPTDINCLAANIDRLLKRIASRGTAFAEVLSYIECYPDMSREFLNAMQCRDSLDHFRRWCAARQKRLRRKSA